MKECNKTLKERDYRYKQTKSGNTFVYITFTYIHFHHFCRYIQTSGYTPSF